MIIVAILPPVPELTLEQLEKRKNVMSPAYYEAQRAKLLSTRVHRECPFCKEDMRRDASVCPHCRHESDPWKLHEGRWWATFNGEWYWLDEVANEWQASGTPSPSPTA